MIKKMIVFLSGLLLLYAPSILAQDFCQGNFDYDKDVDGTDASVFKENFGRSAFQDPCPPDGPAPVEKTWQWISYATGDDGDLEHGAMWPNPRFTDNGDGTITDNLTGLMWLKDANCIASWYPGFDNDNFAGDGHVIWQHALDFVAGINDGSYTNCAGNPAYNDWRVPSIRELHSLIHYGFSYPALPCTEGPCHWTEGNPFINVLSYGYWSSTTHVMETAQAWYVYMNTGNVGNYYKTGYNLVWPVRGGQ